MGFRRFRVETRTGSFPLSGGLEGVAVTVLGVGRVDGRRGYRWAAGSERQVWGDIRGTRKLWGVDEVGVGPDRHKSSVKFYVKRGMGVVTNESAECCIRSSRATTVESIAEEASPANPLTRPCEPLVDGAAA